MNANDLIKIKEIKQISLLSNPSIPDMSMMASVEIERQIDVNSSRQNQHKIKKSFSISRSE